MMDEKVNDEIYNNLERTITALTTIRDRYISIPTELIPSLELNLEANVLIMELIVLAIKLDGHKL
jgi:hypothetical protein